MGTYVHLFGSDYVTADGPAFAKAMAWQTRMNADTDRSFNTKVAKNPTSLKLRRAGAEGRGSLQISAAIRVIRAEALISEHKCSSVVQALAFEISAD